ncbi:MAG: SDR family NAD(P)-dependent oxidoreductase [Flavobacteriaceae bacterium]|nr:SDR family NAD(P)-dependent oxidoreductase [Flavobacteriaceae bacterium]
MSKTISILGCGWLGLPLAKSFVEKQFSVKGSTTSPEKAALLKVHQIAPYVIKLHENGIEGEVTDFLKSSILVIDIPPGLRSHAQENFVNKIAHLKTALETSDVAHVIFISSTSVFGDYQGTVDEASVAKSESESGRQLRACEQSLLESKKYKTTVIRFGGLVGPDRHPVVYLSGRKNLPNGNAHINFIHLVDCIGLIHHVVENNIYGIVHGVAPKHPQKAAYYQKQAAERHIPKPEFDKNTIDRDYKKVVSCVLNREPVYKFQHLFY